MKSTRRKKYYIITCAALLLTLLAQPAPAGVIKNWVGPKPNTLWTNANNWSPTGPPAFSDDVFLTSTTNKTAFYDATVNPQIDTLTVDASGGSTFTLFQPGNALTVNFNEIIGNSGKGQVVQTGGTHNSGDLEVGFGAGSSGTYTLQGGSLTSADNQVIGRNGTGLFTQTGGSNTANLDGLNLGENVGGVGTYNLNGGHLQATDERIGKLGKGTVNQLTNSTNIISGTLTLGTFLVGPNQGSGTYNMKGGYLQAATETVGDAGSGSFTQSGGTHTDAGNLNLGNQPGSKGSYTLSGISNLSANNEVIGNFGLGVFTQSSGTNTVASALVVGQRLGPLSTYSLTGGNLTTLNEIIGNRGNGAFTQSGGTHTISIDFRIAALVGSSGNYNLNAGNLQAANEYVAGDGIATFTQVGGTHTVTNALTLAVDPGSSGTYNLKQGSLQANSETIADDGTGTFNQTGGTHKVTNTLTLGAGAGTGTYNLQGGSLSAGLISINTGSAFNVKNVTTTVTGDVLSNGTIKTTNATVTWNGFFSNAGAYISDPSTQTFNKNLDVVDPGYLVGGSQDLFVIKNDFVNQSTQNTQWNTVLSSLKFVTGADNIHELYVPGEDNGPHGQANNFTWGSLNLTGQKLFLVDGNGGNPDTAFYAEAVIGATFSGLTLTDITNNDTNPINIYYNANLAANAYLHGLDYTIPGIGGGQLRAHTPVPPSVLLLGSGLLGLGALGWRRRRG